MKILALLLILAAASPLPAQRLPKTQSIVAPCQFVSANLALSGETRPGQGRGFSLHVVNRNSYSIALPAAPRFGWLVETQHRSRWRSTAEGGPVRRIGSGGFDTHLGVTGPTGTAPMVTLAAGQARDFRFFLPQSDAALRPDPRVELTRLRLTLFWAASNGLRKLAPNLPRCGIEASWQLSLQRLQRAEAAAAR